MAVSRVAVIQRPETPEQRKLWEQCCAVEGMFLQQMLTAMRRTAPDQDGLFGGGVGLKMTRDMMDEQLAEVLAKRGSAGVAGLLYRGLVPGGAGPPAGDGDAD